jgi:hypothetical protein
LQHWITVSFSRKLVNFLLDPFKNMIERLHLYYKKPMHGLYITNVLPVHLQPIGGTMNDENNKNGLGGFQERNLQPTQDERAQARLEYLLANVEKGWKISIIRVDPSWCRGHLETKDVYDDSDQVDISYLIDNWGGHRLQLKVHGEDGKIIGGGTVSLFSYPPKVHGQILKRNQHYIPSPAELQAPPPPYYHQQPVSNPAPQLDLRAIVDLLGKQKGTDVAGLLKVLEFSQARQQPAAQLGSMADQMMGLLSLMREMQTVFGAMGGGNGGAAATDDQDGFAPIIAEVVKGLVQRQNPPEVPSRGALVAPRQTRRSRPVPRSVPQSEPQPVPTDEHPGEQTPESILSFADDLSRLEADDAAGVVLLALEKMPPDKRNLALQTVAANMDQGTSVDDSSKSAHTDCQEFGEDELYPEDFEDPNPGR